MRAPSAHDRGEATSPSADLSVFAAYGLSFFYKAIPEMIGEFYNAGVDLFLAAEGNRMKTKKNDVLENLT